MSFYGNVIITESTGSDDSLFIFLDQSEQNGYQIFTLAQGEEIIGSFSIPSSELLDSTYNISIQKLDDKYIIMQNEIIIGEISVQETSNTNIQFDYIPEQKRLKISYEEENK